MKFSRQLEFNSHAPWQGHYLPYRKLKKLIKLQRGSVATLTDRWHEFRRELDSEYNLSLLFFSETLTEKTRLCNKLVTELDSSSEARRLREDCLHVFLEISELENFVNLTSEGYRKLIKKFDKLNGTHYQTANNMTNVHSMRDSLPRIHDCKVSLVEAYAKKYAGGSRETAAEELGRDLEELIVWDKGTIWNDLLRLERNRTRLGVTRAGVVSSPESNSAMQKFHLVVISIFLLIITTLPFNLSAPAQRCLALLILVSGFWAAGWLPLFVTALAIPWIALLLELLPYPRGVAASKILGSFWGSSQALVLGSFALAAGLSKLRLDKAAACRFLSLVGSGRKRLLFGLMIIGWIVSALIGNVAASVLALAAAQPILDELPQRAARGFPQQLLLGVAFACNLGGMTSPVASTQNIIAFAALTPLGVSFGPWVAAGVSVSFLSLLFGYGFLLFLFHRVDKPEPLLETGEVELPPRLREFSFGAWGFDHACVAFISVLAVSLWMTSSGPDSTFGDVGVASLLPLTLLFSVPGLLTKADFLSLPWDVCALLSGGSVLALVCRESTLLEAVGGIASEYIRGSSPALVSLLTCAFVTFISSFVSHTAAANVLMPFIVELSVATFGVGGAARMAVPAALCLSAGMALPVSSFPNINALSVSPSNDSSTWLKPSDFIFPGAVLSIFAAVLSAVLGDFILSRI